MTVAIDTSALGGDFPAQPDRTVDLTVGMPVVIDDLPIGPVVSFTEAAPADDDLFTWGDPVFSPESVMVAAAHTTDPAQVTLTNSVERTVGSFALVKSVTGEQADNAAVPAEVTVTATWVENGTPGEMTLTVPTDGTAVSLGEDLLIGTEVTLTETPLADGSSIAWGAPVWSGAGVAVDGESAVVTIGRDAQATVSLENHAATSVAGMSLIEGLAGEAAGEVDAATEFPVTASWVDAAGDDQSRDLLINAVTPTALGVDLPAGTVVTITEGTQPGIDTVVWGSITISGAGVTDSGKGSAEVVVSDQQGDMTLISVVNEATWAPGTFTLSKNVTGVLLNNPAVPGTVTVIASWVADGERVSEPMTLPTDGTSVPFGADLPHGTEVTLSEDPAAEGPAFTWDTPIWAAEGVVVHDDGTATILISAATDIEVALTNNATATLGNLAVTKTLSGDGASEVPAGAVFPVTATWVDLLGEQHKVELELTAGEATVIESLPFGTEVTLTEREADVPSSVKWLGAAWSTTAENVVIDGAGAEVVVIVTGEAGALAEVSLENEFEQVPDLPITGGGILAGSIVALGAALIAGGVLLTVRRRREA